MKLFNFFKKKEKEPVALPGKKVHFLYHYFTVELPSDWEPFESDRFRAKTKDESTQISITVFSKKGENTIDADFFKELKLKLYDLFVVEGEYEPHEDLLTEENFISKSFKVDDETQYYLTTAYNINGKTFVMDFIIRNTGDYNAEMRNTLLEIKDSVQYKVMNL